VGGGVIVASWMILRRTKPLDVVHYKLQLTKGLEQFMPRSTSNNNHSIDIWRTNDI